MRIKLVLSSKCLMQCLERVQCAVFVGVGG